MVTKHAKTWVMVWGATAPAPRLDIAREHGAADLEDGQWVVGDVDRPERD